MAFPLGRGGEGAAAQDGYVEDEKIGKLEKAFRRVLDLSCFRLIYFYMTRAFKGHEVVPLRGVFHKRIRSRSSRQRDHLLSI